MLLHYIRSTKSMKAVDITEIINLFAAEEDIVLNVEEIGEVDLESGVPVIWKINVGLM